MMAQITKQYLVDITLSGYSAALVEGVAFSLKLHHGKQFCTLTIFTGYTTQKYVIQQHKNIIYIPNS